MANTYQPTSAVGEHYFGSEPFEAEFTPAEERDWLDGKHVELVPRAYEVLVDNYERGEQGSTIEAAYLVEIEAALISGGVLRRYGLEGDSLDQTLAGTVDEVRDWIGDDRERAEAVLDRETGEGGKDRKGVVGAATQVLDAEPDDEN